MRTPSRDTLLLSAYLRSRTCEGGGEEKWGVGSTGRSGTGPNQVGWLAWRGHRGDDWSGCYAANQWSNGKSMVKVVWRGGVKVGLGLMRRTKACWGGGEAGTGVMRRGVVQGVGVQ